MHILDLAPTLQKPQSRKPLITEVIPAKNILRKSLVQLYLPLSLPDEKAIWRTPAPSLSKVDMILLSLTLGTQKLRRSHYFSPSPGRAAMQRALSHLAQGSACSRAFLETQVLEVCARAYRFLLHREQCFSNLGGELFDFFFKKSPFRSVTVFWYFHYPSKLYIKRFCTLEVKAKHKDFHNALRSSMGCWVDCNFSPA